MLWPVSACPRLERIETREVREIFLSVCGGVLKTVVAGVRQAQSQKAARANGADQRPQRANQVGATRAYPSRSTAGSVPPALPATRHHRASNRPASARGS